VRRKRIAAGLSQSGLARLAGITQPHVSAIERGKSSAGVEVLQAIAKALKCPVEEIMYKRGKTGRR
jgi:transcriptional regulator with XRE-family HTH domain